MNYEVKQLPEKKVVGVSARTGNDAPDMQAVIGGLWNQFYQNGVCESLTGRKNQYSIGLYSGYEGDTYEVTVGAEAESGSHEACVTKVIPAGKYAVFSIEGDMVHAVSAAWSEIWQMNLERTFTGDYEEYLNADPEKAKVNIYVAIQ